MFTLDQARSFVAVAEERHFSRAAERLNMTQPPLSRQIQKLERSIGVELLERNNRGVKLTAAGEAFLVDARRLIIAAERAPLNAQRIKSGQSGELRIGFTAASGFSILGKLLADISKRMPAVHLELFEMVTSEQVETLQDGDIDLGLARPPINERLFDSVLLFSESMLIAVPTGHRLQLQSLEVTINDVKDEPLIMHSPIKAQYFYDLVVRHIDIEHRNVVQWVSQIVTMISLVSARRGIAFVPESTRRLGMDGVSYLRLADFEDSPVELHAIWSRNSRNPALAKVIDVLRESLTD